MSHAPKPTLEQPIDSQETIEITEETPLLAEVPIEEETRYQKSTFRQTTVNSLNLLMGMGLLSLPYAFAKLGWVLSLGLLLLFCCVASFTAHLLGRLLKDSTQSIVGVAHDAFGITGQFIVGTAFSLELFTAGVAMLILFSDSVVSLVPQWADYKGYFMVAAFILLTPLTWQRSLSKLSWMSFVGVLSLLMLVFSVFWSGMTVQVQPGSILNPSETYWYPTGWKEVGLGIGLLFVGLDGKTH
jgi:amino acid permease